MPGLSPFTVLGAYILGVVAFAGLERIGRFDNSGISTTRKQILFQEPVAFEGQRLTLYLFLLGFVSMWILIFQGVIPRNFTYDAVFGPVVVTGCWWFTHLVRNTWRVFGRERALRLFYPFVGLWFLANGVDLGLIYLGAWYFSPETTLGYFSLATLRGGRVAVPWIEVFGFNLFISWFILFMQVFLNELIRTPGAVWRLLPTAAFRTWAHQRNLRKLAHPVAPPPKGPAENPVDEVCRAAEAYETQAVDAALTRLFHALDGDFVIDYRGVKRTLNALRRKKLFFQLQRACEVFLKRNIAVPLALRQKAQALIDQGEPRKAPFYLSQINADSLKGTEEWGEARGLFGRTYKQTYVDTAKKDLEADRFLLSALEQYRAGFLEDRDNLWLGINFVACAALGNRDGLTDKAFTVNWRKTAREILDSQVAKIGAKAGSPWELAICLEACVALKQPGQADAWAKRYAESVGPGADVFEFGSTYRQLKEIWKLEEDPDYAVVLERLRAAILGRPGGSFAFSRQDLKARPVTILVGNLERSTKGLARIETKEGTPVGTGFLVSGRSLCDQWEDEPVFITASHVIGEEGNALRPAKAYLNFLSLGRRRRPGELLWHSPESELDIVVFAMPTLDSGTTLPIVRWKEKEQVLIPSLSLVFVLGHPLGLELQVSCSNNRFVGSTATSIRYKTETEPGSSGSPVLDGNWQVVGVHTGKAAGEDANEGVHFEAIAEAVKGIAGGMSKQAHGIETA